jgi:D-alanyl-D-alanine carboxypeptidase
LLMQDPTFRATVARRDARLHGQTFPATNELLSTYAGADGVKTGSTTRAGFGVIASATRQGRSIAVAVLGSSTDAARFDAAAALLDWAFTTPP